MRSMTPAIVSGSLRPGPVARQGGWTGWRSLVGRDGTFVLAASSDCRAASGHGSSDWWMAGRGGVSDDRDMISDRGAAATSPDDYEQRRRTLSIELERRNDCELYVEWLDGYESCVAMMSLLFGGVGACWQLQINDPPLGHLEWLDLSGAGAGTSLLLKGERPTLDPRTRARLWREGCALVAAAAERELEKAIDWATHLLGDGYVVVREATLTYVSGDSMN
jgi:hypothetical protein